MLHRRRGSNTKQLHEDNLSVDYPDGWTVADDSNDDARQFTLSRSDSDVQIRVFVHKGRITAEKLPDAKKAFIDHYISATAKQWDLVRNSLKVKDPNATPSPSPAVKP